MTKTDGFYAIGQIDGLEVHLKAAPKNPAERRQRGHDSEAACADGVGTKDFYIEDPDGYIICFGGRPLAD